MQEGVTSSWNGERRFDNYVERIVLGGTWADKLSVCLSGLSWAFGEKRV